MSHIHPTSKKNNYVLCVVPLPHTTYGSWSCDEKFALPSLAHELLVTWLPTRCWYKKVTAGVKKHGTFLMVPRDFHDFQIVRYVSQKKTNDTSMSTLARKEASQPWEQERMGVLGWCWKPISLEHRPKKHLQHTNPPCTSSKVGWLWLMADLEFHDLPQLSVCQAKHLLSLTLCSMKLHLIIGMGSQLLTKKPLVYC